ncbi:hypothetical protein BpHYR1_010791 [Brachionus plicatilis]|uniref:Uncharacterized protein n=1 Tax=Brachionus plicatilis TaxID=10195 RepID=A0A3M7QWI9_BRAPC|nr:hypothetical protein BpHYR1_010791 [Brachionus plicatilis]
MLFKNILVNHSSEYWYIGSMLAKSLTQKNNICVLMATGTYSLRVASMSFSVCSDTTTFDLISVDLILDCSKAFISSMSSTGFSDLLSLNKMVSSISFIDFWPPPNRVFLRPPQLPTFGPPDRLGITASPSLMTKLPDCLNVCLRSTGSRAGSSSVDTFSSKHGLPKRMAFSRLLKKSLSDSFITSMPLSFSNLTLGIDEQRPSLRKLDNNTVLYGQANDVFYFFVFAVAELMLLQIKVTLNCFSNLSPYLEFNACFDSEKVFICILKLKNNALTYSMILICEIWRRRKEKQTSR